MDGFEPKNDGIDHINVYSKGKTEIGRLLSNFAHTPFVCGGKKYASVEGFWYYLKTGCRHEHIRNIHGYLAKQEGRKYETVIIDDFESQVLEAIRCKFRQNKELLKQFVETKLPLAHYYWYGEIENPKVYHLPQFQWIINELERIREVTQKHWNYGQQL